jgi:hypothetical protein
LVNFIKEFCQNSLFLGATFCFFREIFDTNE